MGLATPSPPQLLFPHHHQLDCQFSSTGQVFKSAQSDSAATSMSQGFHHQSSSGLFNFSDGFDRHSFHPDQQQHVAQQRRRDKLRVQGVAAGGFESAPPPLVAIEEEEQAELPVYGMLSEMFNFSAPSQPAHQAHELLMDSQIPSSAVSYQLPSRPQTGISEWYGGGRPGMVLGDGKPENNNTMASVHHHHQHQQHQISGMNTDSAAAMQLFLMKPQPRSPSPPPPSSSTPLNMLLQQHSSPPPSMQAFHGGSAANNIQIPSSHHFTWGADHHHKLQTGVVEGQGLSLSLSSSLQPGKPEELLYYSQGGAGGASSSSSSYPPKNLGNLHLLQQVHMGYGSMGIVNVLRNSKYAKAAQELLEEFCSVGRGQLKGSRHVRHSNPNSNSGAGAGVGVSSSAAAAGGGSSSSSKEVAPLSPADRFEHQRRKTKLITMLDEVDRRYNHYCEQMQMVVNSFDSVMGFGAAMPYTALAQKAMSRHFRCLKDAIAAQLKHTCELLGEKDAMGGSGITKGETPRLKILEQSLRQQRAFHQMGMMEQEAWRPQRGLPERSVNILRAWLFEHFLHPYPSDADKHLLARQTGLSRNQVSNWFINARVRLWKPMVEEMYQQEGKEDDDERDGNNQTAQTPTASPPPPPPPATAASGGAAAAASVVSASAAAAAAASAAKRSDINAHDSDISHTPINRHPLHHHHHRHHHLFSSDGQSADSSGQFSAEPDPSDPGDVASGLSGAGHVDVRFGASPAAGDVSLTLGLRHAGNLPDKGWFSVGDFGNC